MWRGVPLVVALGVVCLCQVAVARIEVSVSWELYSSAEVQLPPRQQHAMSSIGDTIFLFGGLANGTADNSLHAFSTTTESWQDLSAATVTGPVPRARYGHGMEAIGEQLLVFGGIDSNGTVLNDLFVFDVARKTWTDASVPAQGTPPAPRYLHGTAEAGSLLFVLGGRLGGGEGAEAAGDLMLYDAATRRWEAVDAGAGGPGKRFGHGMAGLGNVCYVFGGATGGPAQGRVVRNDLHAFYFGPNRWEDLGASAAGTAPAPRLLAGMVASGNALYLFGGLPDLEEEESFRELHIFDLQEGRWVQFEQACTRLPGLFAHTVFAGQDLAVLGLKIFVYGHAPGRAQASFFTAELQALGVEILEGDAGAPPARVNHGMAAVDDSLFVFAGSADLLGRTSYDDLYSYHLPSRSWRNMSVALGGRRPRFRFLHGMVAVDASLWIFGGGTYLPGFACTPTPAALSDLHAYHTLSRVWTEYAAGAEAGSARSSGATPLARWGHGMVAVGATLYVFGGYSQTDVGNSTHPTCARAYLNDLHAFDTTTRTWIDLSSPAIGTPPETRAMGGLAEAEGVLYVFGGLTHFANEHHNDLHAYTIALRKWEDLSTPAFGRPPSPRAWFPMGIAKGTLSQNTRTSGEVLYVIGGYRRVPSEEPFLFFDLHAYDIKTRSWEEIEFPCADFPPPPSRLYQHMAIIGNIFYLFGGTESASGALEGPLLHALLVCPSTHCDIALPALGGPGDATTPAPSSSGFFGVLFQARLSYARAAFTPNTQTRYLAAVARAAQVAVAQVQVTRVEEEGGVGRRRLWATALLVDTLLTLPDAGAAEVAARRVASGVAGEVAGEGLAFEGLSVAPQVTTDPALRFAADLPAPPAPDTSTAWHNTATSTAAPTSTSSTSTPAPTTTSSTTTPAPDEEDDDEEGGGLGAGPLAGMVVGVLVGVGMVGGAGWVVWARRQAKLAHLRQAQVDGTEMPGIAVAGVSRSGSAPPPMEAENSTAQPEPTKV